MRKLFISALAFLALPLFAQKEASIRVYPQQGTQQISKHIYGQFAEHLGTCIYGGLWVGPDSDIPNTQGYRNDVLNALKKLQIPNLRWPGGCFADEYHWMDGIRLSLVGSEMCIRDRPLRAAGMRTLYQCQCRKRYGGRNGQMD